MFCFFDVTGALARAGFNDMFVLGKALKNFVRQRAGRSFEDAMRLAVGLAGPSVCLTMISIAVAFGIAAAVSSRPFFRPHGFRVCRVSVLQVTFVLELSEGNSDRIARGEMIPTQLDSSDRNKEGTVG